MRKGQNHVALACSPPKMCNNFTLYILRSWLAALGRERQAAYINGGGLGTRRR
jgi:hypothetical protein